jgi:cell shape-determining protein MreC
MLISASSVGLIIFSLGIVALMVAFTIADRKRALLGFALSGFVLLLGVYQYVSSGFQQWQTTRRISKLQDQQRMNLEALQDRLRQAQEQNKGGQTAAPQTPAPAPSAAPAPAAPRSRRR